LIILVVILAPSVLRRLLSIIATSNSGVSRARWIVLIALVLHHGWRPISVEIVLLVSIIKPSVFSKSCPHLLEVSVLLVAP
jgi:hypothetical protein